MNKELFGVFGDRADFEACADGRRFDAVVEGPTITVGVRDPDLGTRGRTAVAERDGGLCVVWGEAFPPDDVDDGTASWLLDRFRERGPDALSGVNGSHVAVVDDGDDAVVAVDQVRSWECFYADVDGVRAFGTDPAAVARTLPSPAVDRRGLLEFYHLGVVLGTRTMLERLHRIPFDGVLRAASVEELSRFVYQPREFDYAGELAARMERAVARRTRPDRATGLMLSAGYDSRTFLSQVDNVERCYTVGEADCPEVRGAARLAGQYGVTHTVFPPDDRYLRPDDAKIGYSKGIKESLHVHHGGYADAIDTDVVFHGLWFDTLLRGYFTPQASVEVFGKKLPLDRQVADPRPVETLLESLPYAPEGSRGLAEDVGVGPADHESFVRDAVRTEVESYADRLDDRGNAIAVTGISNQPAAPFRAQLADNHCESWVAVDSELLDWHRHAPATERSISTFLDACRRIDPGLLRHRPPDRKHDSRTMNALHSFVQQSVPFLESPGAPWPDRDTLFDEYGFDEALFPDRPELHGLLPRHKLRLNDARGWLSLATGTEVTVDDVLAACE